VLAGLILAAGCALATNVGFLFRHRGAALAPPVSARHPLRSGADLFRSRAWTIGWAVAVFAWVLHAAALALAPLSSVQAVVSGGLVFLVVLAERFFDFTLRRREWAGVAVAAVGLTGLGITQRATTADFSSYSVAALIAFECGVIVLGALVIGASLRFDRLRPREGELLGIAAGMLFGVSDIAVKYLTHPVLHDVLGIVSPWTLSALVASVIAFYTSARALQIGPGIEVIALTSVSANVAAIFGGVLIFHDSIGSGAVGVIARTTAFALVIFGAALMPAPAAAEEITKATES
jgi:hypothetical protein